jgi:hypothetical protein
MNIRAKIFGGTSLADEPLLKAKRPKGAKPRSLDSVVVPRETRRQSNSRGGDRHRLSGEKAQVTYKRRKVEVELLNLSGGGAMISGAFEPKIWERVDLHLGEHGTVECAVRWIRNGRVGLEFAHETRLECKPDKMVSVLREVISRSFPDLEFRDWDDADLGPSPDYPEDAENHRAAARHPLIWSADLHYDYDTSRVRIRNISSTGAMIETKTPVRVGAEPMLQVGELTLSATVVWAVGDQVGLHFWSDFDMDQLAQVRPNVTPATWSVPSHIKKSVNEDSPWDPRWNRMGLKQLQRELEGFLRH